MNSERTEQISELMTNARADTLGLFELAAEASLTHSPGFGVRPIIWHLAHIGVFEAYWILQKLNGESAPDQRYERIFDPIGTPREESKNLPTRSEMEGYLSGVRARVLRCLEKSDFASPDPFLHDGYVFHLVLQHEYQHQETVAYLLHLLGPLNKKLTFRGGMRSLPNDETILPKPGMATIPEGPVEMGSAWASFAYDNELPSRMVNVPAFSIDRLLTTNEEYARFIEEGGYERRELWSEEGWLWREKEEWSFPLYWSRNGKGWHTRRMFDDRLWQPNHPVTGTSWYEADAYARFTGHRLPTEAEWERAASSGAAGASKRRFSWGDELPAPNLCNHANDFWGTTPVGSFPLGASPSGCLDMTGNVWEWTADEFAGYPGFKAFPYPDYSALWFDGDHKVLKGGSWATRAPLLRTSFRNFFRRHFRIAFAGIRCACDA